MKRERKDLDEWLDRAGHLAESTIAGLPGGHEDRWKKIKDSKKRA